MNLFSSVEPTTTKKTIDRYNPREGKKNNTMHLSSHQFILKTAGFLKDLKRIKHLKIYFDYFLIIYYIVFSLN